MRARERRVVRWDVGLERRFGTWLDRRTLLGRAVLTYGSEFNLHFAIDSLVHEDGTGIPRLNCSKVPTKTVILLTESRYMYTG
jgi:hypothetical protein